MLISVTATKISDITKGKLTKLQEKIFCSKKKKIIFIYFGFIAGTHAVEMNSRLLCFKKCYRQ